MHSAFPLEPKQNVLALRFAAPLVLEIDSAIESCGSAAQPSGASTPSIEYPALLPQR